MGHRITRAASHLCVQEVKKRMYTETRPWVRIRWWVIYSALVDPRKAEEIALHTGVSIATVHRVISIYNRLGPAALETPGKGGRRHQYLTLEEEEQFLAPFFAQAEHGEIATVREIHGAFEERVGHAVDDSTIYRLLHRHGWRKCMPRPQHPKADPHVQEQFKASFPEQVEAAVATRAAGDERPVLIMAQDEGCGCPGSAARSVAEHPLECVHVSLPRWCESTPTRMLPWLRPWAKWSRSFCRKRPP